MADKAAGTKHMQHGGLIKNETRRVGTRISGSVGPAARRYSPQSFAPHRARGCAYADVSRARP
jgi:hypothetical protein